MTKLAKRFVIREFLGSGEVVEVDPSADKYWRARLSVPFPTMEAAEEALTAYIAEKGYIPECTILPHYMSVPD